MKSHSVEYRGACQVHCPATRSIPAPAIDCIAEASACLAPARQRREYRNNKMSISNMRIGARLGAAFALVVALLIGTAAVGIQRLDANTTKMERIVSEQYSLIALSNQIKNNGYKANGILSNLLLAASPEQSAKYMADYAAIRQTNANAYARLEKLLKGDHSKALFKEQFDARSAYGASVKQFFELVGNGKTEEARTLYQGDMSRLQDAYYVLVDKMVDYQASEMERDVTAATSEARNAKIQMIVLAVCAALLAITTGAFITRTITRPIRAAVELAKAVAQGNLTHRLHVGSRDEVGQLQTAFQHMVENLHSVVAQVRKGTDTITHASHEVASGNLDLSGRTEQQASSLEQTAAAMEQLTSTVKQNADNAHEASRLASGASSVAAKGGDAVDDAIHTMNSINTSSRKIVDIIGVIDSIAFQPPVPASKAAALPSWPVRCAAWRSAARQRPRRSRRSSRIPSPTSTPAPPRCRRPGRSSAKSSPASSTSPASFPRSARPARNRATASSRSTRPSPRWTRPRRKTPPWWKKARPSRRRCRSRPTSWPAWSAPSSSTTTCRQAIRPGTPARRGTPALARVRLGATGKRLLSSRP
jgi:methyl-accepting chemotaxis protein